MTPLLLLFFAATRVHCQAITETKHIDAFVDMHNRLRRTVYPPAANMAYVSWSAALATNAASAECGYPDIAFTQHNDNGRNYFRDIMRGDDIFFVEYIIPYIVEKWFMDKWVYIYENNTCPSATKESCDAFRLIISPALSEIGCAVKKDCSTTGYHQYLCLYDTQVTDSSTPIYKAGVSGSGCAGTGNATEASGYSSRGLCLMTASRSANIDRMYSYCEITCKNCATDQSKDEVPNAGICRCATCLSGYSGADCSIKGNEAAAPVCGLCQQQGTPCLNNGVDKSANGKCICDCGTDWAGPQCEMQKDEYNNAIYVEVSSTSNNALPVDPKYIRLIRLELQLAVEAAINAFCVSSNITNVAKCCKVTKPKAAPTDPFLDHNFEIKFLESGLSPNGNLGYALVVKLHHSNKVCESKPNHDYTTVPLEVLVESLKAEGFATDMRNKLLQRDHGCGNSACHKLVAESIKSYKGFADDKYGIKTPDSITTTNGPQTDGNKDTTTAATAAGPGTTTADGPGTTTADGPGTTTAAGTSKATIGVFLALLFLLLLLLATACRKVKLSVPEALGGNQTK